MALGIPRASTVTRLQESFTAACTGDLQIAAQTLNWRSPDHPYAEEEDLRVVGLAAETLPRLQFLQEQLGRPTTDREFVEFYCTRGNEGYLKRHLALEGLHATVTIGLTTATELPRTKEWWSLIDDDLDKFEYTLTEWGKEAQPYKMVIPHDKGHFVRPLARMVVDTSLSGAVGIAVTKGLSLPDIIAPFIAAPNYPYFNDLTKHIFKYIRIKRVQAGYRKLVLNARSLG